MLKYKYFVNFHKYSVIFFLRDDADVHFGNGRKPEEPFLY